MKKRILVKGPALSRSGYGEQTRFALNALRSAEDKFEIFIINIPWGATGHITTTNELRTWIDGTLQKTVHYLQQAGQFDISLQVTIPNEFEPIAPINVGYTAGIETNKVAPQWIEKGEQVDKIILVSHHSRTVYENTTYEARNEQTGEVVPNYRCTTPMETVNYCVRGTAEPADIGLDLDYDFNFLAMAQAGPRKNLANTIKWFVEEFIDQEVGLVVKANIQSDSLFDRRQTEDLFKSLLRPYGDRKNKVYLLHGTMEDEELAALYNNEKIKAMVSLSHGEGFGLPLFEAVCNGMPVICPLWSGQSDFLYAPTKDKKTKKTKMRSHCAKVDFNLQPVQQEAHWEGVIQADSLWCVPEQGSYKMKLREVYKNYPRFKSQAERLKKYVLKEMSADKQYAKFVNAIWELVEPSKEEEEWKEYTNQVVNYD